MGHRTIGIAQNYQARVHHAQKKHLLENINCTCAHVKNLNLPAPFLPPLSFVLRDAQGLPILKISPHMTSCLTTSDHVVSDKEYS